MTTTETMEESTRTRRQPKKQKYMSKWETSLFETSRDTPSLSLERLFDAKGWLDSRTRKTTTTSSAFNRRPCSSTSKPCTSTTSNRKGQPPITFRLEHREGGALATHQGEERILLFRSDRKGAIAKIIFSSTPASTASSDAKEGADDNMAQAKIHVLDVKDIYRGMDLGGLLFSEALLALKQRYLYNRDENNSHQSQPSVRCQLDAEEDMRRANKLVGFYQRHGCIIKPKTRPQFLNNNDGETYRKVPMQIDLKAADTTNMPQSRSLVGNAGGFLPVLLLGADGKTHHDVYWLMTDDGKGHVQFRTSKGRYLTVDPEGRCSEEENGTAASDHHSIFQLLRVSDATQHVLSGDDHQDDDDTPNTTSQELCILWSPHGTFLSWDPHATTHLQASKTPAFWQAQSCGQLSLTCVLDTPTRRQHYRQTWIQQTVEYVVATQKRYSQFQLAQMPLKKALFWIKACPAFPFRLDAASRRVSMRTLCFRTAQAARAAGHPDWIQFVALIHALGSVAKCIDVHTAIESEDEYDWTIPCKSRVVGCPTSADATFAEFAHLNDDRQNDKYSKSPLGMYPPQCGFENVHLTWSGPEYLYHLLKHNDVDLPDEGLAVLRLFPLYDWHSKKQYQGLANEEDTEILPFVRDFYYLHQQVMRDCSGGDELTDAECEQLWSSYYERLTAKFGADGILDW